MSSVILRGQPKSSVISQSLSIIRKLLATEQFKQAGLTTAEMYKLALKEAPPPNFEKYVHEHRDTEIRYTKSGQRKTPPPSPPHMDHPIRSMRFLKSQILPILEGLKEIRMTTGTRLHAAPEAKVDFGNTKTKTKAKGNGNGKPGVAGSSTPSVSSPPATISHTVHLWMPTQRAKVTPKDKVGHSEVLGAEVGRGVDWDHLNRRRQRARDEKIKHDVDVMVQVRKQEKQEMKRKLWEAFTQKEEKKARIIEVPTSPPPQRLQV